MISWNETNVGQKVGIIASCFINLFFGLLIWKYSNTMPDMSFMNPKEYDEVFDMENIKIDVNKKGKLKVKGGAK